MSDMLKKLNYKGQDRIAVISAEDDFMDSLAADLPDVKIDTVIDPRFPYSFIIIFVRRSSEVVQISQLAIHNLVADGVLWFCYPKKTSKLAKPELNRDNGWKPLHDLGFYGIRLISIDDDWSALRFRNSKFIKSTPGKYPV
ncbi:MAG TPA: hypothetical protein VK213_10510 [Bacteroidales bacterium]|nr:hypothetical protein [Bacteroidales bacterium]